MSDPLSIAASIVAVLQLSKAVVGYIKDVNGGSEDRVRLRDSIWSTISLLEMLNARFEDAIIEGENLPPQNKMDVRVPLRELQRALETLVLKLAPASRLKKAVQKFAWPFDKKEIDELLIFIESQKSFFGLALQNDHMQLTQSLKSDLKEVTQDIGELRIGQTQHLKQLRGNQEQEVIDWISPIRFWEKQIDIEDERVPETSEWVLLNDEFLDWLKGDTRNLWCHGIPGAGKTVIASVIINYLLDLQQSRTDSKIGVAFIYCNYKEQENQTMLSLLSSILHQLALRAPEISQTVMDAFEEHHKKRLHLPTGWVIKAMTDIISKYGPVYLVIDALDECSDSDGRRTDLMTNLKNMPENLKILCTSRDLPDIKQMFDDAGVLHIHARNSDVEKYLIGRIDKSVRLKKHCKADPSMMKAIINTVVDRVDGMFLLAQLHVEILSKKQDRRSVRRALETLPTTLDDTYDQALQRIQSQDTDDVSLAQSVLYWISFAVRPLSIWELRCAIAAENLDPDENDLDDESYVDEEVLIDVCAGIVAADKERSVIRLVHYSTQEYFERNRARIFPYAQARISRACLRYLSLEPFSVAFRTFSDTIERQQQYPLFEYASENWGHHAVQSPEGEVIQEIFKFFQLDSHLQSSVQSLIGTLSHQHVTSLTTRDLGLWISSRFGLVEATKRLVVEGADINVSLKIWSDTTGTTSALRNAIANGYSDIVQILLDHGAKMGDDDQQENLLVTASFHGHLPIIKLLLQKGYDIRARDEVHGSALIAAVKCRSLESCKYLIESGASLQDWIAPHGSALGHAVAQYRSVSNVDSQSPGTNIASKKASTTRNPEPIQDDGMAVARLLLDIGADLDVKNAQGQSLLVVTTLLRNLDIAQALLDAGVSPNTKDWLGRAILEFSMTDLNLAMLFIIHDADVNNTSLSGETALHYAASVGEIPSAVLLLEHGAQINVMSGEGYTPFDKALMHGKETAWLEDRGATPGSSPLSAKMPGSDDKHSKSRSSRLEIKVVLEDLEGEAWNAEFSNDGKHLATYGDSGVLNIYQTENFSLIQSLADGSRSLSDLSWSSDDSMIITASVDECVRLWDIANGVLLVKLPRFDEVVYDCLWVPDKPEIVTCCMGMSKSLCLWSIDGTLLHDFGVGQRIMGCAFAPESGSIIAFGRESIYVYDPKTFVLLAVKDISAYGFEIQNVSVSHGSPYAMLQIKGRLLVIRLETLEIVEIFEKEDERHFVIKSSFGGAENKYVACGSESGNIFLWDWGTRELISKTMARKSPALRDIMNETTAQTICEEPTNNAPACCNSVSWHPTIPNMLVSAGDDGAVIVWNLVEDSTDQRALAQHEDGIKSPAT